MMETQTTEMDAIQLEPKSLDGHDQAVHLQQRMYEQRFEVMVLDSIQLALIEMTEIASMEMDEVIPEVKKLDGVDQEEHHRVQIHDLKFEVMVNVSIQLVLIEMMVIKLIMMGEILLAILKLASYVLEEIHLLKI